MGAQGEIVREPSDEERAAAEIAFRLGWHAGRRDLVLAAQMQCRVKALKECPWTANGQDIWEHQVPQMLAGLTEEQ